MKLIPGSDLNFPQLAAELKQGKTIAYPTETSFGLGCDATNQTAVDKIFAIKERDPNKPLLVIVASLEDIKPYIVWDERLEKINDAYWPGPLTVVVPVNESNTLAKGVASNDGFIAFRISSHKVAHELTRVLGKPLVSTSANKAGEPALFSSEKIMENFSENPHQPDLVIAGNLPEVPGSTIIKLLPDGFSLIRQGAINFEL